MEERKSSFPSLPNWLLVVGMFAAVLGLSWSEKDYVAVVGLAVVIGCGISGYAMGGIRLIGYLGSFASVFYISAPLGRWMTPWIVDTFSLSRGAAGLSAVSISVITVSLAVTGTAAIASRWVTRQRPGLKGVNRWIGFGLGAAEGAFVVFVLLCGLVSTAPLAEQRLQASELPRDQNPLANVVAQQVVDITSQTRDSTLGPLIDDYNPFETMSKWKGFKRTALLFVTPGAFSDLAEHPAIAKLQRQPSVRAAIESLANDPQLRALSMSGRKLDREMAVALLNNPNVVKLLEKPELIDEILRTLGETDAQLWESKHRAGAP